MVANFNRIYGPTSIALGRSAPEVLPLSADIATDTTHQIIVSAGNGAPDSGTSGSNKLVRSKVALASSVLASKPITAGTLVMTANQSNKDN